MVLVNDAASGNMAATKLLRISLTLRAPLSLDSQPFPSLKLWFPHPEFSYSAEEYLAHPAVSNANSALPQGSQFHRHMFQYINSLQNFTKSLHLPHPHFPPLCHHHSAIAPTGFFFVLFHILTIITGPLHAHPHLHICTPAHALTPVQHDFPRAHMFFLFTNYYYHPIAWTPTLHTR